jgi:hypothetical protein
MLTFKEHQMMNEMVQSLDPQFTDDVVDKAEYYDIEEDENTLMTTVTIYDANGGVLTTAQVEDYDMAQAYLEDHFDLEQYEPDDDNSDAVAGASRYGHDA